MKNENNIAMRICNERLDKDVLLKFILSGMSKCLNIRLYDEDGFLREPVEIVAEMHQAISKVLEQREEIGAARAEKTFQAALSAGKIDSTRATAKELVKKGYFECEKCGARWSGNNHAYCYNCGARMEDDL